MKEKLKESNDNFLNENELIFKKYKTIKKIGIGAFGNIYSVIRIKDKKLFAMKIEKKDIIYKMLESEAYYLFTLQGGYGIPKLITYGISREYNILIETLLDKSLYDIFISTEKKCNLIDACLIGIQILDILKWIHSKDIIYRDIKPENFLVGIPDPNVIYIVDFGLCKKYRSSKTGKHILPKNTKKFNGTLKFVSSNVLKGKESSRRDDLISLGYMLIYLLKRNLPKESSFKDLNKKKYYEILNFKETNDNGKLFKDLPQEIVEYFNYSRNLKFEQDPDYSYLSSLFKNILFKINLKYKRLTFSWINPEKKELLGFRKNKFLKKSNLYQRLLRNLEKDRKSSNNINKKNDKNNAYNCSEIKESNQISSIFNITKENELKNFSFKIPENEICVSNNDSSKLKKENSISLSLNIENDKNHKSLIQSCKENINPNIININLNINKVNHNTIINKKNYNQKYEIFNHKTFNTEYEKKKYLYYKQVKMKGNNKTIRHIKSNSCSYPLFNDEKSNFFNKTNKINKNIFFEK